MDWKKSQKFEKLKNKPILAIDYGTKRIGTATFCPGRDPFPLLCKTIENKNLEHVLKEINHIVDEELIEIIIIGKPHLLDGKETEMTQKTVRFKDQVQSFFKQITIYMQDETLSSFEAEERMKKSPEFNFKINKTKLDQLSASILIEDFLRDN